MLTDSEKRVIIFLIFVLITGSILRYFYPRIEPEDRNISPFPVNINTAGREELTRLPGIGNIYAERIIKFRKREHLFKRKEEIMEIKGIGRKTFENLKDKIVTGENYD